MPISETKMKIVIDNYFKAECNVNTSIREAFEKGFRIGVQKGYEVTKEPEHTAKVDTKPFIVLCHNCQFDVDRSFTYCPGCGARLDWSEWE